MLKPSEINAAIHARRIRLPESHPTPAGKLLSSRAPHGPIIFADTAKLEEILPLKQAGIIHGVTTNPTLLKRAGADSWDHAKEIMREIAKAMHPLPVSLELIELEPEKMIKQAEELAALADGNAVIKVPVGGYQAIGENYDPATGLKVIRALWERDIKVNCTLIFNSTQAMWAAMAGATFVSPFLGRLADYLYKNDKEGEPAGSSLFSIDDKLKQDDAMHVADSEYVAAGGLRRDAGARLIHEVAAIFTNYDIQTQVLASSFRNAVQITECLLAGADVLTVPADILKGVADHPLSDAGMKAFVEDSKTFDS
jgi:transaldolase